MPVRSVSAVTGAMGILGVGDWWVLGTARALSWWCEKKEDEMCENCVICVNTHKRRQVTDEKSAG